MTFEQNAALPKRFVTSYLPWLLGLGALVVYLATMTRWATYPSSQMVVHVAGWSWAQDLYQPLQYLVFYPFRFLPAPWIPPALNLFNAAMAALVIVLVARSIALLPHDRTADQRELEDNEHAVFSGKTAWIPPTLGALVLGLQISFWESATALNGNMLDALVAAYILRCLLEFRVDGQQSWLSRAAFLFAAGMADTWAFVGLAPVFLAAVIWLKGLRFFNLGFISRMAAWTVAGWLFYLLLPFVQSHRDVLPLGFWAALKMNLSAEITTLRGLYRFLNANNAVLLPVISSLLPLLFIGLRWKASFGDNSPIGIFIAKAVFHFAHALFFGVCLLVTLNPPYSPRQLLFEVPAMFGGPYLIHAILSVIVTGYCAGYLLLICSPALKSRNRMNPLLRFAGYAGWGAVVAILIVMPVSLIGRNLEAIQLTNNKLVDQFAAHLQKDTPSGPCVFVSDDSALLAFFQLQQLRQGKAKDQLFYDSSYATFTDYHKFAARRQPGLWPAAFASVTNNASIRPPYMVALLGELSQKLPVVYLNPSFGYYFERFQQLPHGINYPLKPYSTNALLPSPLNAETVAANESFWKSFDESVLPLVQRLQANDKMKGLPGWRVKLYSRLHLTPERVYFAEQLAFRYARTSVNWAVQQQRRGDWEGAAVSLQRALALFPGNVAAQINLAYNEARRAGKPQTDEGQKLIEDFYHHVQQVLNAYGELDEPTLLFEQSRAFLQGNLPRQGLIYMDRVAELEPNNYPARIFLADIYTSVGQPKKAFEIIQHVRANPTAFSLNVTNEFELARCEATALFRDSRKDEAAALLARMLKKPMVPPLFQVAASQLYLQNAMHAEALPLLDNLIASNPDDGMALANRGFALLQLNRDREAITTLSRAIELDPKNSVARMNRGLAFNRTKQFDAALEDWEMLAKEFPNAYRVLSGLAEAAAGKGDLARAKELYEKCLRLIPGGSPDFKDITQRLEGLKAPRK